MKKSFLAIIIIFSLIISTFLPVQTVAVMTNDLRSVLGVTRKNLVTWLESHSNDDYYLGTRYKPYDWRSPNGDLNSFGIHSNGSPGMNCTGFVWHALIKAGADFNLTPQLSNWSSFIKRYNIQTYVFRNKGQMLASEVLEKGDIIWVYDGNMNTVKDTHHVGIFWGDTPSQDRFWHSIFDNQTTWSGFNRISPIVSFPVVTYVVVKTELDEWF